jgi:hypothetical protein
MVLEREKPDVTTGGFAFQCGAVNYRTNRSTCEVAMADYYTTYVALHALITAHLAHSAWWRTLPTSAVLYGKYVALLWLLVQTLRMETLDKFTLQRLYVDEQLTIRAIAERLSVNPRKVHDAMIRWRIPRRPASARLNRPAPNVPFDEATLRYHYLDLGQTIKEIGVQLNVSHWLVLSAMKYWQIPRRRCGPKPKRSPSKSS